MDIFTGSALIGSSHPVHMHGHHFEVIKVGYPETDPVTKMYVMTIFLQSVCLLDRVHN